MLRKMWLTGLSLEERSTSKENEWESDSLPFCEGIGIVKAAHLLSAGFLVGCMPLQSQ